MGNFVRKIPLIKPYLTDAVKKAVCDVLDSGHWTEGPVTRALEQAIAEYVECSYALAVTSCTTGMEIALRALGVGPGDEVIVPDYTYPATADVVAIVGATPVIVDIEPGTLLISRDATAKALGPKTKAVMPVSIFGNPVDYSWLNELKTKHGFAIVEDTACSLGAEWQGRRVGAFADISVFSMHPRKFITTGEGGIITTDRADLAEWMNSYKRFGIGDQSAERGGIRFARIGTNYKLSDVLAAIGLGQMRHIAMLLEERRAFAANYLELIAEDPAISPPVVTPGGVHSWQTFYVFVKNRDHIMRILRDQGIEAQIGTYSLHMHPAFQDGRSRLCGDMRESKRAYEETLALPMYHGMTRAEQQEVIAALQGAMRSV